MNQHKRTALITGAGKGVGAGVARVISAQGVRICLNYNSSEEMAQKTLEQIQSAGGEAFLFKADVSDRQQVREMVAETVRRFGSLDILVNNAAMQPNRFIDEYDAERFFWLWNINIGGYVRATQECLPYLRKSGTGRIINVSSVHGKRPSVFDPGYAMTKGAIRMFTREAALELAKDGITVNCIDLGACKIEFKTGHFRFRTTWFPEERPNAGMPLGVTYPEDVGNLVSYLISPAAQKMTGAGIRLDGGAMLT